MAGEDHPEVFQLARLSDEAAPAIAQQHPELGALLAQMPAEPPEDARPIERTGYNRRLIEWKDSIYRTYGERMEEPIELSPLDPGDHTHIDAGVEFDLRGGTTLPLPEVAASLGIDAQAARPAAADLPPFDWDAAEAQFTPPRLEAIGPDITESGQDRRDQAYDLARRMVSNSTTNVPHETAEPGALYFDTAGYQRELEHRTT